MNDSLAPQVAARGCPAERFSNKNHRYPGPIRRATTLIEVLGTLSVLLVLAISATGILGSVTAIGEQTRTAKQGRASIQRLADQLRQDVHRGPRFEQTDGWPLDLTIGDLTIRYDWDAQSRCIMRTTDDDETPNGRDRYPLPDRCDPQVSTNEQIVTFVLWAGTPTQNRP